MAVEFIILITLSLIFVLLVLLFIWARQCGGWAKRNRTVADALWKRISAVTRSSRQLRRQLGRFEGAKSADFSATVTENLRALNELDDQVDQAAESLQLLLLESPDADGRFVRNDYMRLYRVAAERRQLAQFGREVAATETSLENVRGSVARLNTVDDTIRERAQQIREHTLQPMRQIVRDERAAKIEVTDWTNQIKKYDQQLQHIIKTATDDASFEQLDQMNGELEMLRVGIGNLQTDIDTSVTSREGLDERATQIYENMKRLRPVKGGKKKSDYVQNVGVLHQYATAVMAAYPDFRYKHEWELAEQTLSLGNLLTSVTESLHTLAPSLEFLTAVSDQARPETTQLITQFNVSYDNALMGCIEGIEAMPTLPGRDESGMIGRSLRILQSLDGEAIHLQERYRNELDTAAQAAQRAWNKARTAWLDLGRQLRILPKDDVAVQYDQLAKRYQSSQDSPNRLDDFSEAAQRFFALCEQHDAQVIETREWAQKQQKEIDDDGAFILKQTSQYACFKRASQAVQAYQAEYNQLFAQLSDKRHGWIIDDFYESAAQLLDLLTRIRETTEQVQSQHDQLKRIRQDIDYYQENALVDKRLTVDKEPMEYHISEARKSPEFELAQKHLQDGRYFARKAYS